MPRSASRRPVLLPCEPSRSTTRTRAQHRLQRLQGRLWETQASRVVQIQVHGLTWMLEPASLTCICKLGASCKSSG